MKNNKIGPHVRFNGQYPVCCLCGKTSTMLPYKISKEATDKGFHMWCDRCYKDGRMLICKLGYL